MPPRSATWSFVRHGESLANAEGWLAGHVDAPLTERGRDQARARAAEVQASAPERVFTSDLSRARETAELLRGEAPWPMTAVPDLRERHLGEWERLPRARLDAGEIRLMRWTLGPPGGEAPRQVALRWTTWLATQDEAVPTLLVGHGLALKSLLCLVDGRDPQEALAGAWPNVHLEQRSVAEGTWARLRDQLLSEPTTAR